MKATLHIGRGTVKHNDRNFNLDNARHIDQTRQNENFYINRYLDDTITKNVKENILKKTICRVWRHKMKNTENADNMDISVPLMI